MACRLPSEVEMTGHHDGSEPADQARDLLGGPDKSDHEDELGPDAAGAEDELGGPDRSGHEDELGGDRPGREDELGGDQPGREDELGPPV
jgi:hypothetical protein